MPNIGAQPPISHPFDGVGNIWTLPDVCAADIKLSPALPPAIRVRHTGQTCACPNTVTSFPSQIQTA